MRTRPCSKCGRNRAEKFYVSPKGHVCSTCRKSRSRRATKNRRITTTYGITIEEYEKLLLFQEGACAICFGLRPTLDIDHDHAVEKALGSRASVRGLLCRSCNRALSYVRDDPERLRRAADYLQAPPAYDILEMEPE